MPTSDWLGTAITSGTGLLLTAFSANQTKQAAKGEANLIDSQNATALAIAKENTKQAELAYQAAIAKKPSGSNTILYVILGVAGAGLLGVIIYAIAKK